MKNINKVFLFFVLLLSSAASVANNAIIAKKCAKMYKKNSKNICYCVKTNLEKQLRPEQLKALAKVYASYQSRIVASKSAVDKPLLDLDYEVHKNCEQNPDWKMLKEDFGEPNALTD